MSTFTKPGFKPSGPCMYHLCDNNNTWHWPPCLYDMVSQERVYANSVGMGINRFGFLWRRRRRPFESCSAIERSIFFTSHHKDTFTENSQFLRGGGGGGGGGGEDMIYRGLSIRILVTVLRTVHVCVANNSNTPSDSTDPP